MIERNATLKPAPPEVGDPLIGRVLNERFRILETLGSGGMGRVYKAVQAPLDRLVALKVLNASYAGSTDPGFQKRFFLEASVTSKLRHPNTITVIDYGKTDDGIFYIAMEYLEGKTLAQVLAQLGPQPWGRALSIGMQIARSLREAHKVGLIHRDLKPANVMVINQEEADTDLIKVLDFGLVKSFTPDAAVKTPSDTELTQNGVILGSPQYMAPEQARNISDPRSDVYSLGVLLYQTLLGRPPFQAAQSIDVIIKHLNELPPPFASGVARPRHPPGGGGAGDEVPAEEAGPALPVHGGGARGDEAREHQRRRLGRLRHQPAAGWQRPAPRPLRRAAPLLHRRLAPQPDRRAAPAGRRRPTAPARTREALDVSLEEEPRRKVLPLALGARGAAGRGRCGLLPAAPRRPGRRPPAGGRRVAAAPAPGQRRSRSRPRLPRARHPCARGYGPAVDTSGRRGAGALPRRERPGRRARHLPRQEPGRDARAARGGAGRARARRGGAHLRAQRLRAGGGHRRGPRTRGPLHAAAEEEKEARPKPGSPGYKEDPYQ